MRVKGTCGPYTSLFTNSQSPMSSDGIMLPDGMRNASMRKARRRRKSASAPAIDLKLSHATLAPELRARPRPRAAATLLRGALDFAERLGAGAAMKDKARGRGDGPDVRGPGEVSPRREGAPSAGPNAPAGEARTSPLAGWYPSAAGSCGYAIT